MKYLLAWNYKIMLLIWHLIKNRIIPELTIPHLGIHSKEIKTESRVGICALMSSAPLFRTAQVQEQTNIHQGING